MSLILPHVAHAYSLGAFACVGGETSVGCKR